MTFTLTDDLDLSNKEKVLPQGIHIRNMKAVSLPIHKLWPMLKFLVCKQTNRETDRAKTTCPSDLSMWAWKEKNARYQNFLLFLVIFSNSFFPKVVKSWPYHACNIFREHTKVILYHTFQSFNEAGGEKTFQDSAMGRKYWLSSFSPLISIFTHNNYHFSFSPTLSKQLLSINSSPHNPSF